MRIQIIVTAITVLVACFSQPAQAQRGKPVKSFTDGDVSKAIEKGVSYLWSTQLDDGSWGDVGVPKNERGASEDLYYITGLTALACYALLDSGTDAQDPRMQKALDWMAKNQEKFLELKDAQVETTDWRTYSVGLRCNVWLSANKTTKNKYQKNLEKDVNWQIITLKSEVGEWHDAPIVYIGGSVKPDFSDEDVAKLRTYVRQGGTLFVMTQCGGGAFSLGMKDLYKKLFPKYELQVIGPDHEFYKLHGLTGGKARFSMIHNGIRPLVLHTDDDLSLHWQQYTVATGKHAFDAASTVLLYVTDKQIKNRGANSWPPEPAGPFDKTVKVVKLKYAGNCDAEPLALERFGRLMGASFKVKVDYPPEPVEIAALKDSGAKLAILTGTTAFKLKDDEKAALRDYAGQGGLILFDAGGGARGFGNSARELIGELWGADNLLPLPLSSPVYQMKDMTIEKVKYRRVTRARLVGVKEPCLMAILAGDRPKVIFSQEDVVSGLVGFPSYACDGYDPESAFNVMRNIVLYAATLTPIQPSPASQSQPAKQ
ncbi:MAG: DUF4159 domain-containing protein [Planctomycetes bacterium]|nr:DUF4159 domain-containing protein [Planctomycetota bacterium]